MLSGYVPNDAVRADLVAAAQAGQPGAAVDDQMQPGEGAIVVGCGPIGLGMVLWLVDVLANSAEGTSKEVLGYLSILSHLDDFTKGVLASSHIIFYLSLIVMALFLTYRSIDSMRWRA